MPSMFKRSLLRIGNGALAVVVPKSWVDYHGLRPKDVVQVKVNKNLVVYPEVIGKETKHVGGKKAPNKT